MRKFIVLALLSAFTAVAWDTDSSACWRRRGNRRYQCEPVVVCYSGQPRMTVGAPAIAARIQIVATKQFTSPKGLAYRIHLTNHQDMHEEAQVALGPDISPLSSSDDFLGKDRKAAKTSIVTGGPQSYTSIDDLLASLPADQDMMNDPDITKAEDSQRVESEQHNVTVTTFLYAASREKDNDYHLILGGPNAQITGKFMNAEISGLPQGAFRKPLTIPRQAFKDYFGANIPGRSYSVFDSPIPVTVTGSLFYDIDHKPGVVGPGDLKPQTSWEIHPVSTITFEP